MIAGTTGRINSTLSWLKLSQPIHSLRALISLVSQIDIRQAFKIKITFAVVHIFADNIPLNSWKLNAYSFIYIVRGHWTCSSISATITPINETSFSFQMGHYTAARAHSIALYENELMLFDLSFPLQFALLFESGGPPVKFAVSSKFGLLICTVIMKGSRLKKHREHFSEVAEIEMERFHWNS